MEHELQHFLISRTQGEAPEVIRGAERESGLERWRRLAALYEPVAAGRSLDVSRLNFCLRQKVTKIDVFSHAAQGWEKVER